MVAWPCLPKTSLNQWVHDMGNSTKPRKPYKPRPVALNTLEIAIFRAAKPSKADIADVLGCIQVAHKALREGVATLAQWGLLSGAVTTAKAIDHKGVVTGIRGHLDAADRALSAIYDRANLHDGWKPTALYFDELDAIKDFMLLHSYQVKQLGRAEYVAACNRAAGQIRATGCTVTFARDIPALRAGMSS